MASEINIVPMTPSHLDQVLALENLCFSYPFSRSLFESELNQPAATLLVARDGKQIIGYIDFWKVLDEIHLINLGVHPDYRRKGVGTQLFRKIPPHPPLLKGGKGGFIYLEVRVSNEGAKKFYEKLGFQVIGMRKNYYPDGEDALIMELRSLGAWVRRSVGA